MLYAIPNINITKINKTDIRVLPYSKIKNK